MSAAVTTIGALNRTGLNPACVFAVIVKLTVPVIVSRPPPCDRNINDIGGN